MKRYDEDPQYIFERQRELEEFRKGLKDKIENIIKKALKGRRIKV